MTNTKHSYEYISDENVLVEKLNGFIKKEKIKRAVTQLSYVELAVFLILLTIYPIESTSLRTSVIIGLTLLAIGQFVYGKYFIKVHDVEFVISQLDGAMEELLQDEQFDGNLYLTREQVAFLHSKYRQKHLDYRMELAMSKERSRRRNRQEDNEMGYTITITPQQPISIFDNFIYFFYYFVNKYHIEKLGKSHELDLDTMIPLKVKGFGTSGGTRKVSGFTGLFSNNLLKIVALFFAFGLFATGLYGEGSNLEKIFEDNFFTFFILMGIGVGIAFLSKIFRVANQVTEVFSPEVDYVRSMISKNVSHNLYYITDEIERGKTSSDIADEIIDELNQYADENLRASIVNRIYRKNNEGKFKSILNASAGGSTSVNELGGMRSSVGGGSLRDFMKIKDLMSAENQQMLRELQESNQLDHVDSLEELLNITHGSPTKPQEYYIHTDESTLNSAKIDEIVGNIELGNNPYKYIRKALIEEIDMQVGNVIYYKSRYEEFVK